MRAGRSKSVYKIIILGDSRFGTLFLISSVGKTSLMTRYVDNRYTQQYRATVGADFMAKDVMIDDKMVSL